MGSKGTLIPSYYEVYSLLKISFRQMLEDVDFSKNSMRTLRPIKPEQHNYSDCGIYLLHYVEKIFSSVAQFYWPETVNTLNDEWFPLSEVFLTWDTTLKE